VHYWLQCRLAPREYMVALRTLSGLSRRAIRTLLKRNQAPIATSCDADRRRLLSVHTCSPSVPRRCNPRPPTRRFLCRYFESPLAQFSGHLCPVGLVQRCPVIVIMSSRNFNAVLYAREGVKRFVDFRDFVLLKETQA